MGICRRRIVAGRFCAAPAYLFIRGLSCRRSIWRFARSRNQRAGFYTHFPKRRDDDFHPADYRRAVAFDQLQRFVCAHDHVRSRNRKQRLGSSESPRGLTPVACSALLLMETDYKVRLEIFEGPLDLLLFLIKRDELDIYDISLERITSQYLEYLQAFKELNIDVAGEFIVMAANLLYIKSRSLLPADQQPPEEEAEEDDPRWELIRQLIEYKKFKEAAAKLHDRALEQENIFMRGG